MNPYLVFMAIFTFTSLALADRPINSCQKAKILPQEQEKQASLVKEKFKNECPGVVERMNDYGGVISADIPQNVKNDLLTQRCELTTELLSNNVITCTEAKDAINDFEISQQVEKTMPTLLARVAYALPVANPEIKNIPHMQMPQDSNFFTRFINAYREDSNISSPNEKYRGYPAPLDGSPFPNSVWPYGGSPVIGQPNSVTDTPFMQGLKGTKIGDRLVHIRVNIYGWLNGGGNISNSHNGGYANAPAAYYQRANTVQADQEALYIERVPDTVQNTHFDWGFRVTGFYGLDYRFTTSKGIFSNQLLKKNHENGFDVPMAYVDLYYPVLDGLNVRLGRFISVPDIEAQLATSNYTYSHSLMYSYDDYTQTGVIATLKLNKNWLVQGGLTGGSDVALWTTDATPTGVACGAYTWSNGKKNIYVCDNSINNGKYAYNNMNEYVSTFSDKLSTNWHTATEFYFLKERDVPSVTGSLPTEPNANGAYCPDNLIKCTAGETGAVNYLERQFGKNDYLSIRNGYLNDPRGQRTGTPTLYSDHVVGIGHWTLNKRVLIRPEAGFYHSYDTPAFDDGAHKSLKILACDVVWTF